MNVLDSLSEEQIESLREGETIKICTKVREPLPHREVPTSINLIEIEMKTRGVIGNLEDEEQLIEEFSDVIGVRDALENE